MVAQGLKSIADLFWRSSKTNNLRCNIGFASVFSTGKKFNGSTFFKFVKKLLELSYKIVIVTDSVSQHKTKMFKEFVKENRHRLRIMYLPTGCPELGTIEKCWHRLKIQSFMYEYHEHVSGHARATMKYPRTVVFSQNI